MVTYFEGSGVTLHHGDCLDVLRTLPDASVDSVVTDPPYNLAFMGREWDSHVTAAAFGAWCLEWASQCLRVLKPGGHLLAFGGTRTWHRLACAVEDAGFEVRDSLAWLYGSGFPKSLNVAKAIDGKDGRLGWDSPNGGKYGGDGKGSAARPGNVRMPNVPPVALETDAAREWEGWGTALKPAFEPVVVARKPLIGTVAANVLTHGTGALNVDGCRIGMTAEDAERIERTCRPNTRGAVDPRPDAPVPDVRVVNVNPSGRWPANVVLDEDTARVLDEQSGEAGGGTGRSTRGGGASGEWNPTDRSESVGQTVRGDGRPIGFGDTGGASRFFFVARSEGGRIEPCESANTAGETSSPPSESAASALAPAATSEPPATSRPTPSRSTSAKGNGSRPSDASATPTTPSTDGKSSPGSRPARLTPTSSPVNGAAENGPTDTTTTTTSPWTSGGSAAPVTSSTTSTSREAGAPALPIDTLDSRFTYTAKADASERPRVNGTAHPTVKPLALMRWLVRLVTPPGGTVLEPFAGSGTTVEACLLEGFRCIAVEKTDEYLPLILARIHRQRDPVQAIRLAGDDLGLFELGGEGA